jgi:hypothetical protein
MFGLLSQIGWRNEGRDMSRRIIMSDLHMSAGLGLTAADGQYPWEWFTNADLARLEWFLQYLYDSHATEPIDDIVLLGDVFDNWVFPHDMKPPTLGSVIQSSRLEPIYGKINALTNQCGVLFMPGNHDYTLTHSQLMSVLPRVGFGGRGVDCPQFGSGQMLSEHGNGKALFCSPDPKRVDELPLGYFISRIAATATRKTGNHDPSKKLIENVLKHELGKEKIAEIVVDVVAKMAGLDDASEIVMPDDLWCGKNVTIGAVKKTYADLFTEFDSRYGAVGVAMGIAAECGDLAPIADTYLLRSAIRLVVMGHTHCATAQQHHVLRNTAYVNSGCWCGNATKAGWVDVRKENNGQYAVSVNGVSKGTGGSPYVISEIFSKINLN